MPECYGAICFAPVAARARLLKKAILHRRRGVRPEMRCREPFSARISRSSWLKIGRIPAESLTAAVRNSKAMAGNVLRRAVIRLPAYRQINNIVDNIKVR
jgi:hypothetical protein